MNNIKSDKPNWIWETRLGRAALNLRYWVQHTLEEIQHRRTMKRVLGDIQADIALHRLLRGDEPRMLGDSGVHAYHYNETTNNIVDDIKGEE